MTRLKRNQIANACKKGLCALSPNKRDWINDVHYNYNALYIGDIFSVFKIENSCDLLVVTSAEEKLIKQ